MSVITADTAFTLEPSGPRPKRRFAPATIMIYTALIFFAVYYLIPLYVMTVTSLKGLEEVRIGNIFAPPLEITFEPWVKAWDYACTGLYCEGLKVGFLKSVYITVPSVIVSIAVGSVISIAKMPAAPAPVVPTAIVFQAVPLNTSPSMTGPSTKN